MGIRGRTDYIGSISNDGGPDSSGDGISGTWQSSISTVFGQSLNTDWFLV